MARRKNDYPDTGQPAEEQDPNAVSDDPNTADEVSGDTQQYGAAHDKEAEKEKEQPIFAMRPGVRRHMATIASPKTEGGRAHVSVEVHTENGATIVDKFQARDNVGKRVSLNPQEKMDAMKALGVSGEPSTFSTRREDQREEEEKRREAEEERQAPNVAEKAAREEHEPQSTQW